MINDESLPALPRGARLEPDGQSWLLYYSIHRYDDGERFPEAIDVAIPVVAQNYEDALAMARLILGGLKAYPGRRRIRIYEPHAN